MQFGILLFGQTLTGSAEVVEGLWLMLVSNRDCSSQPLKPSLYFVINVLLLS